MSAFVWLDYSERERRKMLDVVDLFREHDTRDELGIGSVRDAFADLLFPGTSTIMTRPLRIPYGNKEVALKLGARYRSGGWYAPPGVDLAAFGERGWL